jgi:hypothetical protein
VEVKILMVHRKLAGLAILLLRLQHKVVTEAQALDLVLVVAEQVL